MKLKTDDLLLYAVTDRISMGDRDFDSCIREAIEGGVTMVQLREKGLGTENLTKKAERIARICHEYGLPLIIDDDYKAALAAGADGVHVGAEDTAVSEIRRVAGDDFIIGATAKTVDQARQAEQAGADYLGVGAVFPSPTKKNAIRINPDELCVICGSVNIPCVAIGGINRTRLTQLPGKEIAGIAVVSAVFGAEDIRAAASDLLSAVKDLKGGRLK